jgi:plasmid stability protein
VPTAEIDPGLRREDKGAGDYCKSAIRLPEIAAGVKASRMRRGRKQRKSCFLQWNGPDARIKLLFISTTCAQKSILGGSMEFCHRTTNSSRLINRKTIEFVRDELPAGWFGHLDINITLAKSYLAWCEDNMGVIVIRNLSLETHRALQARAARHNRSTEAEARMILDEAVRPKERVKLGSALAAFGRSVGGLDLDISRDPTSAKPIDLG